MNVQDVIITNQALVRRASDLNTRAGEVVFPVPNKAQLATCIKNALQGAVRVTDIANPSALKLPALDEMKIDQVLANSPDEIDLLGGLSVEYRRDSPPMVRVPSGLKHNWRKLPDEGVRLPDGRLVEVRVEGFMLSDPSDTSIPMVKRRIADHLNERQWNAWDEPTITAPNPSDPNSSVCITTAVYGQCALSDEDLVACGTVEAYQPWSDEPITWRTRWYKERSEAETVQAWANNKLETDRTRLVEQAEREAAEAVEREATIKAEAEAQATAEADKQEKLAVGRTRIENLNHRRQALGWEMLEMRDEYFGSDGEFLPYTDEACLQTVETEVAQEERKIEDLKGTSVDSSSLSALAAHFNN